MTYCLIHINNGMYPRTTVLEENLSVKDILELQKLKKEYNALKLNEKIHFNPKWKGKKFTKISPMDYWDSRFSSYVIPMVSIDLFKEAVNVG